MDCLKIGSSVTLGWWGETPSIKLDLRRGSHRSGFSVCGFGIGGEGLDGLFQGGEASGEGIVLLF